MKRLMAAVVTLLTLGASVAARGAEFASPEGIWELEFRDSRYAVSYCEGDALCGELIWLSEGASTPEKTKYLNTMLIKYIKPTAANTWTGEMDLLGERVAGTVKQVSDDVLELSGCKFIMFCRSYKLYRVPVTESASN